MSALNTFVTADAVHMFTDGGMYDPTTAKVAAVGNKTWTLPEYGAVLGATGQSFIPVTLGGFIAYNKFQHFDDLAADLPGLVERCITACPPTLKNWGKFNIVLAGWSAVNDGPSAHHLCGYARDGKPAFHCQEITRFRIPEFAGIEFDPANPAEGGLTLMRAQRDTKYALADAKPNRGDALRNMMARTEDRADAFHVVHGFCQHTRVDRDGVHTKILERWD